MILWKLGIYNSDKPSASMLPNSESINKLRDLLATNPEHIIWGPELSAEVIGDDNENRILCTTGETDHKGRPTYYLESTDVNMSS